MVGNEAESVAQLFGVLLAGGLCARLHECMARECRKQELHVWIGLSLDLGHVRRCICMLGGVIRRCVLQHIDFVQN